MVSIQIDSLWSMTRLFVQAFARAYCVIFPFLFSFTSSVQVGAISAQLQVPVKQLLEGDVVLSGKLDATGVGGLDNNSLSATLDGDRDDSHGLGGNGGEDEEGD